MKLTMEETNLINKLKELQQIKPRKEWVILAKNQLFADAKPAFAESFGVAKKQNIFEILNILPSLIYQRKLAYAFATLLFVVVGMFGFAQYTMPGDILFSVKKITEQSQTALVSPENQLQRTFDIATKRLDDLTQVVKNNRIENIAPAIREFQASISEAAKNLVASISDKDSKTMKDVALQIKKIEENKKELQTLGVDLGATDESQELNDALAPLIQREIEDLEGTSLTEEQQATLEEIKVLYAEGNYSEALEEILLINN